MVLLRQASTIIVIALPAKTLMDLSVQRCHVLSCIILLWESSPLAFLDPPAFIVR